jgi:signal transduction histidine kinase/sugar phosphate isomerase/epimerase
MRLAFHTTAWGPRIDDIDRALDSISRAGFEGIEICQRPSMLGPSIDSIDALLDKLKQFGLVLVGLDGGALQERMAFCGNVLDPFLYVESWDNYDAAQAVARGFRLALHPHAFTCVDNVEKAKTLLQAHPDLRWLPDTAHLFISGDDPVGAISHALARLEAVHLQDWDPAFGRSSRLYMKGLVGLGEGVLDLRRVVEQLRAQSYRGWLVAERAATTASPSRAPFESALWLYRQDLLSQPPLPPNQEVSRPKSVSSRNPRHWEFMQSIDQPVNQGFSECAQSVVEACRRFSNTTLASLWDYDASLGQITLLAVDPLLIPQRLVLAERNSLGALAVKLQRSVTFNLSSPDSGHGYERSVGSFDFTGAIQTAGTMLSVPIFNPVQPSRVQYLLMLADESGRGLDAEFWEGASSEIARVLFSALDRSCAEATLASASLWGPATVAELANQICSLTARLIPCEGTTMFLVDTSANELFVAATTGIVWNVSEDQRTYRRGEGLTGSAWARNEAMLVQYPHPVGIGKSDEVTQDKSDDVMLIPIRLGTRECMGVMRCRGKWNRLQNRPQYFAPTDVSILEALLAVAAPRLDAYLTAERQTNYLLRLTHELKMPLVAIRAAAQLLGEELRRSQTKTRHEYAGDILSYSDLMARLVEDADVVGQRNQSIKLRPTPTRLLSEVIAPAVRQVRPLLLNRGFLATGIRYSDGDFRLIPALSIDRNRFQQVFFNLLSNAIKYAFNDPLAFNVEIACREVGNEYRIYIRDWGMGVETGLEGAIFTEGFRGPSGTRAALGSGLGLWVVKRLIQAHGGSVALTSRQMPTEFTIALPSVLAKL